MSDEIKIRESNETSTSLIVVSGPALVYFRARVDVKQGDRVTAENAEGVPAELAASEVLLHWNDAVKAGEQGLVSVPAVGFELLPAPATEDIDDDDD